MGFALPSGVVNTDSAYFFADRTFTLGPLVKQLVDQTLVIVDYTKIEPSFGAYSFQFAVDVSSNPALVVSYPKINATREILTFLLSGGIKGQQYNISITINTGNDTRTDVLTVNIPSFGDCDCVGINPVPSIYTQLPLGEPTQGYVNTAVRFFWGAYPPANPTALDQWYNTGSNQLMEWVTNGVRYFWNEIAAPSIVHDAPDDGVIYSRFGGGWTPDPIQADVPKNNQTYARRNQAWLPINIYYIGASSTPPTQMPDGDLLTEGVLYFDSVNDILLAWDGAQWISVSGVQPVGGLLYYQSVANQTVFSLLDPDLLGNTLTLDPNSTLIVSLNGVQLTPSNATYIGDYTVQYNASTITLNQAATAQSILSINLSSSTNVLTLLAKVNALEAEVAALKAAVG